MKLHVTNGLITRGFSRSNNRMTIAPVIMAAHGTSDCMWKRYSGNYPVHILTNYAAVLVESAVTSTVSFGIIPNNLSKKRKNSYQKKDYDVSGRKRRNSQEHIFLSNKQDMLHTWSWDNHDVENQIQFIAVSCSLLVFFLNV